MQVSSWMVHMESTLSKEGSLVDDLNTRCILFIKVPFYSKINFETHKQGKRTRVLTSSTEVSLIEEI